MVCKFYLNKVVIIKALWVFILQKKYNEIFYDETTFILNENILKTRLPSKE